MGFCCMKPNLPVPVFQPMVVATALPNATTVKTAPWISSSRRRNVAIPEVGCSKSGSFDVGIFSAVDTMNLTSL